MAIESIKMVPASDCPKWGESRPVLSELRLSRLRFSSVTRRDEFMVR